LKPTSTSLFKITTHLQHFQSPFTLFFFYSRALLVSQHAI
jgi:hypothetical protein